MIGRTWPYADVLDALRSYADDDWLMLSRVVDLANSVTGAGSSKAEIAEVTMRLATDLFDHGCPPGDLVADDRDFVPWEGARDEVLARLRAELEAMVARDRLPEVADICWFTRHPG